MDQVYWTYIGPEFDLITLFFFQFKFEIPYKLFLELNQSLMSFKHSVYNHFFLWFYWEMLLSGIVDYADMLYRWRDKLVKCQINQDHLYK